jgi:ABC-type dipeptide/oligopeptide/nickel transport system permease component
MGRFRFLRGRLLQAVPVVVGVTIVAFFILRLIPGDPTSVMLGAHWTRSAPQRCATTWASTARSPRSTGCSSATSSGWTWATRSTTTGRSAR